ncbi:uncharacterized protein J3D65DRAFT_604538 [Phyllosticta citribraziliensis]|uniref:Uncharacterized protein n=1 Tax=Phyllosticta citribraziliensis TaxID=989973 RepID=A0ABR1LIU5_9PEZI
MCRTYHWTCNICGRSQSRGQRCSNTLAGTVNCPNNTRADGPPPQAEHNGLRCAYCYTPTLKTETHFVNPASFATNARWEPRHAIMSPSRDTNGQQQPAPTDYQSLPSGMAAAMRSHPGMTTTPNPSIHHHQYSNPGHARPVLPHGQHPHHRLPAAPGALPILAQHHHHHGRFASPTPPSLPIDLLLAHPHGRPHHHAVRADAHAAAATPPPFQPHAPTSTPAEHHRSPEQALPLHPHASPTAAAAAAAPATGGGGEAPATGAAHLRPTADMLASMTATRTALFAQAEARRAAAIEKVQREGEQNAGKQGSVVAGNAEVEAAWYAMWAGCGVSPAAVSAAQTVAAVERRGREKRKEDGTSDCNQETSGTGKE